MAQSTNTDAPTGIGGSLQICKLMHEASGSGEGVISIVKQLRTEYQR